MNRDLLLQKRKAAPGGLVSKLLSSITGKGMKTLGVGSVLLFTMQQASAQFVLTGQVRTRTEYRAGQGTLPVAGVSPTLFTSQRTRLNAGYFTDRFRAFTSIQDVRVWGMDASTISNMDGSRLQLHEGWGEIIFNDTTRLKNIKNLSLKIGRQEIAYDDERLLGSLGWLQQGRKHDAAIVKFAHKTWIADAGFAFNQDREKKNAGTLYNGVALTQIGDDSVNVAAPSGTNFIGRMYKSMQYLYLAKELGYSKLTFLYFKDDFQKHAAGNPYISGLIKGVNSRVTTGLAFYGDIARKHKIDASFYYQGNNDKDGNVMDAYMATIATQFGVGRFFSTGPGADYLTGNNGNSTSKVNHRFDPLYGTPHKFWGYMDYFYVADPYGLGGNNGRSPGLLDIYWKSKYKVRDNLTATLDAHQFFAANTVANISTTTNTSDELNKNLGLELDLVLNYNLSKQVNIEGGYSIMMGTNTLDRLKKAGTQPAAGNAPYINKRNYGNWAYVMITIKPDFLSNIGTAIKDLTKATEKLNKDMNTINERLAN